MRIAIGTGQSGGVGKTTTSCLLANYLVKNGVDWQGINLDPTKDSFSRRLSKSKAKGMPKVIAINLYEDGHLVEAEATRLADEIGKAHEAGREVLLCDLGAGQLNPVIAMIRETGITDIVDDIEINIVFTIVNEYDSLAALMDSATKYKDDKALRWIVAKNERDGRVAKYEDGTVLRPMLAEMGAVEVVLTKLHDREVMSGWATSGLLLSEYLNPETLPSYGARARLTKWASAFHKELDKVDLFSSQAGTVEKEQGGVAANTGESATVKAGAQNGRA